MPAQQFRRISRSNRDFTTSSMTTGAGHQQAAPADHLRQQQRNLVKTKLPRDTLLRMLKFDAVETGLLL
ncbi:hypothetical protein T08_7419 [Trichinella sp. T8]|nr:hypothetical protein T08_7419 [Trichinella sp. T8]